VEKRAGAKAWGVPLLLSLVIGAGCGGQVIEPDLDQDLASDGGGSGASSVLGGKCTPCEGQTECGYCLVQIYATTYICPPNRSAPKSGCMNLGERHTSLEGETFTCYYCN
jgi:hypothetical protein